MGKYLNLISYFGGKYPHLSWLINQFPKGNYHFVDIMCGSANVALNVDYPLVTINDINDDIINLFDVLRNDFDEFIRVVYFTPFSRAEHARIVNDYDSKVDRIEKARRYYVRSQLSFGGNGSQQNHHGVGFEYAIQKSAYYRVDNWNTKLEKLSQITDRLRHIQIENRDCFDLYDRVNKISTIVYWDPPYVKDSRRSTKNRYKHELEDDFHEKLAVKVKDAKCSIIISGYDSPLYDDIFSHLYKIVGPDLKNNTSKVSARECLWTNFDPQTINGTLMLDFEPHKISI